LWKIGHINEKSRDFGEKSRFSVWNIDLELFCVPDGIQSEHLASKTTSQFLQQLIFPQSAALLHLSNKLQI
jgi:hypothetical protein